MDAQLRSILTQTVYVAPFSGAVLSADADPTYGAPTSRPCRVEDASQIIRDANGIDVATSKRIMFDGADGPVGILDRIWLPGVDQTNAALARAPKLIRLYNDELGVIDHVEVLV